VPADRVTTGIDRYRVRTRDIRDKGVLDEEESFIDATFAMAKGGGAEIGPTKRRKGMISQPNKRTK